MVAVWSVVVIVASLSSSVASIIGVIVVMGGLSSGLGIVASVVDEVQQAGVSLHGGGTTWRGAAWQGAVIGVIVGGVVVVLSLLL